MNLIQTFHLHKTQNGNYADNNKFRLCTYGLKRYFAHIADKKEIKLQIRKNPCKKKGEKKAVLKHEKDSSYTDVVISGEMCVLETDAAFTLNTLRKKYDLKQIYITVQ